MRDIMAAKGSGQEKLDRIMALIGTEMASDVCSCYVMRAGEVLELFATVGLNAAAVHRTRLRLGEGLVGDIAARARPLVLENAPAHPNFAYCPETGEDPFRAFCGVPILRSGRVRGVLVIQDAQRRKYGEEEIEILQNLAMVLAELISSGELLSLQEIAFAAGDGDLDFQRLAGVCVNRGVGLGQAILHRPQVVLREMVADSPRVEMRRLRVALQQMFGAIDDLTNAASRMGDLGEEPVEILESYRMFAKDRGWFMRMREAIRQGLTAEASVQKVMGDMRVRMSQISDPYIRERLYDVEDLSNRLIQHLSGRSGVTVIPDDGKDYVLVARSLGPAELLELSKSGLCGLVLQEGTRHSHVAIVARALGIPVVGQCAEALERIAPSDMLVVDGDDAQVFVRPSDEVILAYRRRLQMQTLREEGLRGLRDLPAVTRDGEKVSLLINVGLMVDLQNLPDIAPDGIGLFRTELPFMVKAAHPDLMAQTALYKDVLVRAAGLPVVFRTLDIGGDKQLPSFPVGHEENPALGWRALRIGLDRPMMLRTQLRALLMASAGQELRIMFPLVSEVAEYRSARHILDAEVARLRKSGASLPEKIMTGVMIEVPALLFQLDDLLPLCDFVSVGSNDLMQYLFAVDRGSPMVGARYDGLNPALLRALRLVVQAAERHHVSLSICGEMAGRPVEAMTLLGLGFRNLSCPPQSLLAVKAMLRSLEVDRISAYLGALLDADCGNLSDRLHAFARDHEVDIGVDC
ncbi:MAG: phosphoenolpyruvate--protein phosphotransferase [Alphaproteobacteria bacterium GWF2_58_20]|nr:MAG: phosphoenolpyruvate--protein phosphotransferase [Alphaproteobacteria bacterium GWF2_58_20]